MQLLWSPTVRSRQGNFNPGRCLYVVSWTVFSSMTPAMNSLGCTSLMIVGKPLKFVGSADRPLSEEALR